MCKFTALTLALLALLALVFPVHAARPAADGLTFQNPSLRLAFVANDSGTGVARHASQQVCPPSTTTYTLHVESAGGATDRQITINVTAPARSFTFSPKSGPAGSEVNLYLSTPANQLVVYFAGRMLPKKVSPDGKTVTITIPGDASGSGYFELQWDGQTIKAAEPFVVTSPTAQGDLILEDVFLSTGGEMILRVAQSPTGKLSGSFQYDVAVMAAGQWVLVTQGSFQIPTGSQAFWTGYKPQSAGGTTRSYRIRIDPNNLIPETNNGNNEMIKVF